MSEPIVIMDVEKFLAAQQVIVEKNIAKAYELGRTEERMQIVKYIRRHRHIDASLLATGIEGGEHERKSHPPCDYCGEEIANATGYTFFTPTGPVSTCNSCVGRAAAEMKP